MFEAFSAIGIVALLGVTMIQALNKESPDQRLARAEESLAAEKASIAACAQEGDCVSGAGMPAIDLSLLSAEKTPCEEKLCALPPDRAGEQQSGSFSIARDGRITIVQPIFLDSAKRKNKVVLEPKLQEGRVVWTSSPPEVES